MKNTLSGSLNALFKNRSRFQTGMVSRHKKNLRSNDRRLKDKIFSSRFANFCKGKTVKLEAVTGKTIRPEC